MTPAETIATVDPILSGVGAAHYFDETVLANAKENGMDGFRMYFLGRGGVLGDVEPSVVQAGFGYFNPSLLSKMWNTAKERMTPREASRLYLKWGADVGRARFAEIDGLDAFNEAAASLIGSVDPAGLSLFAGFAAEPAPEDASGAAMFNAITLRELRGSVHLAAIVSTGLDPVVAHAIRRPNDAAMFGYETLPEPTDAHRDLLVEADRRTDAVMSNHYGRLNDDQRQALADGAIALGNALAS